MKTARIIYILCLLSVFGSKPAFADSELLSKQNVNVDNTIYYGIVYELHLEQSYIVVSDMQLHYTGDSGFYNNGKARISNIRTKLRVGTPVKFNFYQKPSGAELKDLQVITMREFNKSDEFGVKLE